MAAEKSFMPPNDLFGDENPAAWLVAVGVVQATYEVRNVTEADEDYRLATVAESVGGLRIAMREFRQAYPKAGHTHHNALKKTVEILQTNPIPDMFIPDENWEQRL